MKSVVIVGGGLAGLSAALQLNKYGLDVTILEKKVFPFNRVCGEYVSNEVLPYLKSLGICIDELNPSSLNRLAITAISGSKVCIDLDLGGFGLSRFRFDNLLYEKARANGVRFMTGIKVNDIHLEEDQFTLKLSGGAIFRADLAIGAFGKRSNLDQKLNRPFFLQRSPFLGVKYYIKTDFPSDVIQLDNFNGGYCGICKIEDNKYSLCYLINNRHLKECGSLDAMEETILFKNPHLMRLFKESKFLDTSRQVINEISFAGKSLAEGHILFCGDAAGMITPLCGNGMAMALHSGKIVADTVYQHLQTDPRLANRNILEANYIRKWKHIFALRMSAGRIIQTAFLQPGMSSMGVSLFKRYPYLLKLLVKKTHGELF